ncbi:protein kinase [uncultured Ferrimonas sp.]|uniref:protein kinase domain-containing protein n=1 Tax=uncultured Ferrimonas sp. TaxID=432640 RepID=UPI00261ED760|nr:protein kinase [uncultured Ferrimonas sp.]
MPFNKPLQHFYIPEEQSIYLLRQNDAQKLRQWQSLCQQQLRRLGYQQVHFIGKGVFGFVFAGQARGREQVFKFSRRTLPQRLQDRLEDEAQILALLDHPNIPGLTQFVRASGQPIMQMDRAPGRELAQLGQKVGPLPLTWLMVIAQQLAQILLYLRQLPQPVVHGDIKPSNLLFDPSNRHLSLVDWGSAVLAQQDADGNALGSQLGLYEGEQGSNARMGDVYFIGPDQLAGQPSSPRFDEQGVAATLYALASGQCSRFGSQLQPAASLGLPKPLATILDGMLSDQPETRKLAGEHFLRTMAASTHWHLIPPPDKAPLCLLPLWIHAQGKGIDTVVYSSRKSFLLANQQAPQQHHRDDIQLAHYYRDFLQGMGDNEKAFVVAVSQLGQYPLLGGLALHWSEHGVAIDCSLNLQDPTLTKPFGQVVNNVVRLAQAVRPPQSGAVFKACFFDARDTLHFDRSNAEQPFSVPEQISLPFEVGEAPPEQSSRLHSYFEDGRDPDETLSLPASIMSELGRLNLIHHTGCIIFEVLEDHLKIHSCLRLLDPSRHAAFSACLARILAAVDQIDQCGIAGFMKLPYKNTRQFKRIEQLPPHYYPKDPRVFLTGSTVASTR